MPKQTFTMYLDESGDDILYSEQEFDKNQILETYCTLVGVIIGNNYKDLLKQEVKKLKESIWHTDEVILHSVKIRNKKGAFALFHYKPELYEYFKKEMNNITKRVNPIIVCSSLNKRLWVKKFPQKLFFKDDPYSQAFVYLLERYAHFLNNQAQVDTRGKIIAEKRDSRKDKILKDIYSQIKQGGTQYFKGFSFDRLAEKIEFKKKDMNIAGLQLSDYCCYPFYANHKHPSSPNEHYSFLEQFIYPGEHSKYGHKKWPV